MREAPFLQLILEKTELENNQKKTFEKYNKYLQTNMRRCHMYRKFNQMFENFKF